MTNDDHYVSPPTTFEELLRRLGVNFRAEVTYWDDQPPSKRTDPWGIVVVWTGAPRNVLQAWAAACLERAPGFGPSRKIVLAEAFGTTLDVAAMEAWATPSLHAAVHAAERIVGFVYDAEAERFVPQLHEQGEPV